MLLFWAEGVKANEKRVRTQERSVISAPPEPFVFGKRSKLVTFLDRVTDVLGDLGKSAVELTDLGADDNSGLGSNKVKLEESEVIEKTEESANKNTSTETAATTFTQPAAVVDFDFDGDGKTDIGRWKPNTGEFEIVPSGGGSNLVYSLGSSSSKFVPADFDGLNGVDAAIFDSGTWSYKTSPGATAVTFSFGQAGDIPVPADFDGDGEADATVFRPSDGGWYTQASGYSGYFGTSGDIPVVGDYDGDGKADKAVFRPSTGDWHISGSQAGYYSFNWGLSTDIPVPADYDGDGKTDAAVYRPSTGTWYYRLSDSSTYGTKVWGSYGDQPVTGDFNGDGIAELAVWRPSTGVWYIYNHYTDSYSYQTLGVPGDRAVASAYVKQIGGEVPTYQLAKDRLSPRNSTGGTDLYSQNFGWGTSLVGLPGRAGMNAGFGMSYNSLVWTKSGSEIYFDTNYDNISPGFRFGFPSIEAPYYFPGGLTEDPYWAYVMVSPSGARTEFRQVAASEYFETADSSYLQLQTKNEPDPNEPVESIEITVRGTDGTVMSYVWIAGAFRCTQIKDRNGNFITIEHDEFGMLREVTDTLGREIVVNYDNDLYPTTIQQTWKAGNGAGSNTTHTWATFSYTTKTVATDFDSGLTVIGPPNSTVIKVLDKVTFPDGSYTKFHHNGYIQVYKIENFAPNNDLLNKVETDLSSPGTDLGDVPRFESTSTTTANFNLDGSGNPQPVVVSLDRTENESFSLPGSLSGDATLVETWMTGDPYNTVSRAYYGESGWKEGLVLATETVAANLVGDTPAVQRWTWNNWTQDNVSSSDVLNPRITETRVGDSVSTKRTTIEYCVETDPCPDAAIFGLPTKVKVYKSDLSTVIKESRMEYNLDSAYVNRRIIGLPSKTEAWGWNDSTSSLEYVSKVTFAYDEGDFSDSGLSQNISPIQHDSSGYDSSFITGRGNLTSTTRWDVEYPTTSASAVTSSSKYNTAGGVVSRTSPWDGTYTRTVKIGYTDNWNSSGNPSTFAYPTSVTDPANMSSTVKYRYDIGANVEANSPAPAGQTYGKTSKRVYDNKGRLERDSVFVNTTEQTYTRYEFPTNGIQSQVYSTIVDTNSNGPDSADEVLSESWFDGAGRVRLSRTEHPGSTGGWTGSRVEYDILGRVKRTSVPTEINTYWNPAGDDDRGLDHNSNPLWLWISQEYDWMGRTIRVVNPDGTDTLTSFEGCGCAGGLITTLKGELVDVPGESFQARRTQKAYSDILGRATKLEVLDWSNDVYSTLKTIYNGRDQALSTTHFDGNDSSSTFQVTTATYDGHGRLKTRHRPEQDSGKNTIYNYYTDDSIASVTDARNVVKSFAYNSRGLLEETGYTVPGGSGIQVTPTVSISYDNLGNPIQIADGVATNSFTYDSLSRITSETKAFADSLPNAPLSNNSFKIEYGYTLGGQLEWIKDPFGQQINYLRDKIGRVKEIDGNSAFGGVTDYLSNADYRSWGAPKEYAYGNGIKMEVTFNDRLLPEAYNLTKPSTSTNFMRKEYEYYPDGVLNYKKDPDIGRFDGKFSYDFGKRLVEARSGPEARGEPPTNPSDVPFREDFEHNPFGQMTDRTGDWKPGTDCEDEGFANPATYVNNRNTGMGWTYDADGRSLHGKGLHREYDSAGRIIKRWNGTSTYELFFAHDANGQEVKRTEVLWDPAEEEWSDPESNYFIRSTVLGGSILTEVAPDGAKKLTFVLNGSETVARQEVNIDGNIDGNNSQKVIWEHWDASRTARVWSDSTGSPYKPRVEIDPLGNNYNFLCYDPPENRGFGSLFFDRAVFHSISGGGGTYGGGCFRDGTPTDCDEVRKAIGQQQESVGHIEFFDDLLAPFSEMSGLIELGNLYDMTFQGYGPDQVYDQDLRGTQDSSVTYQAGLPIYQINRNDENDWKSPFHFFSSDKKLSDEDCDFKLSRIFGGNAKAMEGAGDINGTNRYVNNGVYTPGHSATPANDKPVSVWLDYNDNGRRDKGETVRDLQRGGIIHTYTDSTGSRRTDIPLTAPGGWVAGYSDFQYGNSITGITYSNGITIEFVHAGTSNKNQIPTVPAPGKTGSLVTIGHVGGAGSATGDTYHHTHIVFYSDKKTYTTIDPRKLFCGW